LSKNITVYAPSQVLTVQRFSFLLLVSSQMASKEKCDVGLVGLGVMGQNLILNMENKGYRVAIHNRTVEKVCPTLSPRSLHGARVVC
jgi:glutamyl-tRNA reductase